LVSVAGQPQKDGEPLKRRLLKASMEKSWRGALPSSHWNRVVGGSAQGYRVSDCCRAAGIASYLTSDDAANAIRVEDGATGKYKGGSAITAVEADLAVLELSGRADKRFS
jgi:hypothetical protein